METRPVPNSALFEESIATLFKAHPQLRRLFIEHRMACGICPFSTFCSLGDVLEIYSLPQGFLAEVIDRIRPRLQVDHTN